MNDDPNYQARGFRDAADRQQHITWKELRAVRHVVESFLPQLKGRQVLLHEDNTAVVATLTKLTTRSPVMMTELRRLWYLLDTNDIHIRPRYIRSAANVWADTLSRENSTRKTGNSTPAYSPAWKPDEVPTISTDSPLCSTHSSHASTPGGATRGARTSTACVCPTLLGNAKTLIATHPRLLCSPSPPNSANQTLMLPSWLLIGPTKRGTTTSSDSPPQRYIFRRRTIYSSPAGSTSARGSDRPLGASWLFVSHPLVALHPTRVHRQGHPHSPSKAAMPTPHPLLLRTGSTPRYRLHIADAQAPWSDTMAKTFQNFLGTDALGFTTITLLRNSLAPATCANCDSTLRQFFHFCAEENIPPLQATPATMVRYTAWLGLLGTVAASSMQRYFSVVNKYFRDHQLPPIAVGDLLADARRGLEMLQHRIVPNDTRLPLPALVALDILVAAQALRDTLTWCPANLPILTRFRASLAVCVNYTVFCRANTGARCLTGDMCVDRPSQQICLFVRKSKGDQRRDIRDKLVLSVPIPANPILADLMDYYAH
jgi:hypothetical protein